MSSHTAPPSDVEPMRDPKAMRALAHPIRLEILEILRDEGPLTATEVGERIGESAANTAFHLRTLAKYGFVEDAGGGKGRERPWREKGGTMLVREEELDGKGRRAATAMVHGLRSMLFRQIERWSSERSTYPRRWQEVGFEMEVRSVLTPDEVREVAEKFLAVLEPYKRSAADAPAGAEKVTIAAWGFPRVPPAA